MFFGLCGHECNLRIRESQPTEQVTSAARDSLVYETAYILKPSHFFEHGLFMYWSKRASCRRLAQQVGQSPGANRRFFPGEIFLHSFDLKAALFGKSVNFGRK